MAVWGGLTNSWGKKRSERQGRKRKIYPSEPRVPTAKREKKAFSSLMARTVKYLPAMQETWVWSLGQEDPLEEEMATHYNILAWRIPWIEEPGRPKSMGLQRFRHDWATNMLFSYLGHVFCVFISWVPLGLTSSLSSGGCNRWWLWHPMFPDIVGNAPFLTCDAREIKL